MSYCGRVLSRNIYFIYFFVFLTLYTKNVCTEKDPDIKNTVSGMSLSDVNNVQTSWSEIYAKAYQNGFLIFQRLFQADPQIQKFFKYIANATEAELANNNKFRGHILNIMSYMNTAVENLHQPEVVVELMEYLGESHNAKGIQQKHFRIFRDVLLNILGQDLKLGDDVLASWELYFAFINKHILSKIPN